MGTEGGWHSELRSGRRGVPVSLGPEGVAKSRGRAGSYPTRVRSERQVVVEELGAALAQQTCGEELHVAFADAVEDAASFHASSVSLAANDMPLYSRCIAGAPAALNVYFGVADLDRTLHDAVEAGARVIVPRTEIPPGWFAMFLDLDGIPVGVMQLRAAPPG